MELYVRNKNRELVGVIDAYSSVIWTRRYVKAGDFEIYAPVDMNLIDLAREDYYITRLDDKMVGIVEGIKITTGTEESPSIIISGRSAESILNRRIVWRQTILRGKVEECIRRLITENVIDPILPERKIDKFVLGRLNGFPETMEMQVTGDNLLDVISKICMTYGIGFSVTFNDNSDFVFDLYKGSDRSYAQNVNQYVVFSPKFDNLLSSEYESDKMQFKNVALIAGEGEGLDRKTQLVGNASGLDRRELFVDARDLSTNDGEITENDYNAQLKERGTNALSATSVVKAFSGEIEPIMTYHYKEDFHLGDVIQIENEYGMAACPRIWEMIESEDDTGYRAIPTFTTTEV